jgi:hypothetical protein
MAMKTTSQRAITYLILPVALCAGPLASAAVLDAKATKILVSDRVWQQKPSSGPNYRYWSWKSDGSICIRTDDRAGKCGDTGRWKLNAERLCYDLRWGGLTRGDKSACFRVTDHGKGRYEALQDNGLTLFEFTVVK